MLGKCSLMWRSLEISAPKLRTCPSPLCLGPEGHLGRGERWTAPDRALPVSARLCLAPLGVSRGAAARGLSEVTKLPAGWGGRVGEPSDPRNRGCECVYIGLSQPAVSDFRPPLYQETFPWFSVHAGAGRELTPEPSWKAREILDSPALSLTPSFSWELYRSPWAIFSSLECCFLPSQSAVCVFQLVPDF